MDKLQDRLDAGDVLILDGAIGTELQLRGAPMDGMAWCAVATKTSPDILRGLHEDYIRAGADVITSNTYSSCRHVLEAAGLGDETIEINRRAVEIACQARDAAADRPVWIAGALSCFAAGLDHNKRPDAERAKANYREQAEIMAAAGADVIVLEMMLHSGRAVAAVEAAASTGLPVWVGFSCRAGDDGSVLMYPHSEDAEAFSDVIAKVMAVGGSVAGVMHSTVEDTGPALDVLREQWSGTLMAYPESGEEFTMPIWHYEERVSPDALVAACQDWVAKGVQIVGGCCGTRPDHIRALRDRMPERISIDTIDA